jgi:hypothetical protein
MHSDTAAIALWCSGAQSAQRLMGRISDTQEGRNDFANYNTETQ